MPSDDGQSILSKYYKLLMYVILIYLMLYLENVLTMPVPQEIRARGKAAHMGAMIAFVDSCLAPRHRTRKEEL